MVAVLTHANPLENIFAPSSRANITARTTTNNKVNHLLLAAANQTDKPIDKTHSTILSCFNYLFKVEVSNVFCIRAALVIGPTPPGTGVI